MAGFFMSPVSMPILALLLRSSLNFLKFYLQNFSYEQDVLEEKIKQLTPEEQQEVLKFIDDILNKKNASQKRKLRLIGQVV